MPLTRLQSGILAVFNAALHLYPAPYRDEYGREMALVLVDRVRHANGVRGTWIALGAILAIAFDAPGQHLRLLAADLRLAVRLMRRDASFAAVAIGTVALGIGLSSAVFSIAKLLLIDPLPYREADRVAMVWVTNPRQGFDRDVTSYPRLVAWREQSQRIEAFAAFTFRRSVLTGMGDPEQLRVGSSTPELFQIVKTDPVLGRLFAANEEQAAVAVLSHGFWQRKFGAQSSVVGQTLRLDAVPHTVIGVLPASFQFPERGIDAWVPLQPSPDARRSGAFWLQTVARLKPGVTLRQAQEEMSAIAVRLAAERPDDRDLGVALVGLRDELTQAFRPALMMLNGAVLGVLLIACANVAGMLTARGADRRREVAIRTALGASRRRVTRQLLTEAVVLFVGGGLLGVALGSVALRLLLQMAPPTLSWLRDVSLDGPMLAVALAMAGLTGLLFGVLPSWKAAGADLVDLAAGGTRGAARGGLSQRFRRTLVIAEIAVATLVLSATSLMITSLIRAQRVDLGFEPNHVLMSRLQLPPNKYREPATRQQFWDDVIDRTRALPGVTSVAAGSSVLLSRLPNSTSFTIEGRPEGIRQPLTFDAVSPEFFQLLQIPLLRGRPFSAADHADAPRVTIINETTARTYWPDVDPLGKRLKLGDPDTDAPWLTVVGIVADTRRAGVEYPVFTESYQPYAQDPRSMTLVVRTAGDPSAVTAAIRDVVRTIDPDQPIGSVTALDTLIDAQIAVRRFNTWLLTAFGIAASALTAIGLYGLLSYVVALRRREMAIRLSVGATSHDVLSLLVRHVAVVVGIGASLGLAGAYMTATSMRGLLFGITPWDPRSQAATIGLLTLVALAAAWIPARRAMRVDPATVLRTE